MNSLNKLTFKLLTPETWKDFENLFGERGACAGCWCMWWKLKRSQFDKQKGAANKKAQKKIVSSGITPGIIAYIDRNPAGWCAIEPREAYPVLENSRILKRLDDQPVWSVTCFFVDKKFRRKGISIELLKEAVKFAKKNKAKIIEGYPVEPEKEKAPDTFVYHGLASAFLKAGFKRSFKKI